MKQTTKKATSLLLTLLMVLSCLAAIPVVANAADTSALQQAVNDANALTATNYVDFSGVTAAVNAAANTSGKTQTQIDDLEAAIRIAALKLEYKTKFTPTSITNFYATGFTNGYQSTSLITVSNVQGGASKSQSKTEYSTTSTSETATAYVYADLSKVSSSADLGLTATCNYGPIWTKDAAQTFYTYFNVNGVTKWTVTWDAMSGQTWGVGPYAFNAFVLPAAGASVVLPVTCFIYNYSANNAAYNSYNTTNVTIYGVNKGTLRNQISFAIDNKSAYSEEAYANYLTVLQNAVAVLNNATAEQSAIDAAADALQNAIDALDTDFAIDYYSDNELVKTVDYLYADNTATLDATAVKTGYTFDKWVDADSNEYDVTAIAHDFATTDGSAVRLDATWSQNSYNIAFDTKGGTPATETASHLYTENVTLPAAPAKDGYIFAGWKDLAADTNYTAEQVVNKLSAVDGATVTLTAQWTQIDYTLAFDMQGGAPATANQSLTYEQTYVLPATPTKNGFIFTGWKGTDNVVYDALDTVSKLTAVNNGIFTMTAQWDMQTYTITPPATQTNYRLTIPNTSMTYFDTVNFTVAVDAGYTQNPLIVTATNAAITDNGNGSFTLTKATGDVVISVSDQTTINTYKVNFYNDNGTTKLATEQSVNHGSFATAPANPTKDSAIIDGVETRYSFIGWQVDGVTVDVDNYPITADTSFVAAYEAGNYYWVNFMSQDGGTLLQRVSVKEGETVNYGGTVPTKADTAQYHYALVGWSESANSETSAFGYTSSIGVTADTTLYAAFSKTVRNYAVTLPTGANITSAQVGELLLTAVPYGTEVTFTVTLDRAFNESEIVTRLNGNILNEVSAANGVFTYRFTLTGKADITVDGTSVVRNTYSATLPTGTGFAAATASGYNASAITDGANFGFTVTPDAAYNESTIAVSYKGETITPSNGVYIIRNVTEDITGITVTGVKKNVYTVTFVDGNGDTLTEINVTHGEKAVYTGDLPTKAPTAQNYFSFTMWDYDIENTPITADTTVTAQFEIAGVNSYTVTFKADGVTLKQYSVEYGSGATYDGATPEKAQDAQYDYAFGGWDKSFDKIYADTVVNAVFTKTLRNFTVTFFNGAAQLAQYTVQYGSDAVYAADLPTKLPDTRNCYDFTGWDVDITNVKGNITANAVFTARDHDIRVERVEAKCAEDGYIRQICDHCGKIITETVLPAAGHTYGEWVITIAPTHITNGRRERSCTLCGNVQVESIGKTPDHSYTGSTTVEPTCSLDGVMTYTCVCGDTYEVAIPRLGHTCETWDTIREATCTEAGARGCTCARCGAIVEEYIAPLGHSVAEYTANGDGTSSGVCDRCGETVVISTPVDPENPGEEEEEATWFVQWFRNLFKWIKELLAMIKDMTKSI